MQRISLTDTPEHFATTDLAAGLEALRFDPSHAVRMISDLVPNPFVGREIVGAVVTRLVARGLMR